MALSCCKALYRGHIIIITLISVHFSTDGKLLSLDEVWDAVPEYYQTRLKHQRWTFITQQVVVKNGHLVEIGPVLWRKKANM